MALRWRIAEARMSRGAAVLVVARCRMSNFWAAKTGGGRYMLHVAPPRSSQRPPHLCAAAAVP